MADGLGLTDKQVENAWTALAEQGNLSSVSVLNVLHETLAKREAKKGDAGLILAMGPAFCSEAVLFEWV